MKEELKNLFLAGVGSAAYTYEKASELIENLIKKGQLTVEEGKELSEELKRNIKEKTEKVTSEIKPLTKEDMVELLREMNFATKDEINELKKRIEELENNIK